MFTMKEMSYIIIFIYLTQFYGDNELEKGNTTSS